MKRTAYRVAGTLRGPIWWPVGQPADKTFEWTTVDRPDSMRQIADSVMANEDGDFSSAPRMLGDTVLTISRFREHGIGHTSRSWHLDQFRSIADYTTRDMPVG